MKSNLVNQEMSYNLVNQEGICLHIGCGLHAPEQWQNFDASPSLVLSQFPILGRSIVTLTHGPNWPKNVKYGNIVKGISNKFNKCDLVFAAHVLEHLSLSDFEAAVNNVYSYLKPGGFFRFIVPDLNQYVDKYVKYYLDKNLSAQAAVQFMEGSLMGYVGSRKTFFHRLREALSNSRHQWMWDEPSLLHTLPKYGFKSVRKCKYGDWSDTRFSLVEKENSYLSAIGIEAVK